MGRHRSQGLSEEQMRNVTNINNVCENLSFKQEDWLIKSLLVGTQLTGFYIKHITTLYSTWANKRATTRGQRNSYISKWLPYLLAWRAARGRMFQHQIIKLQGHFGDLNGIILS